MPVIVPVAVEPVPMPPAIVPKTVEPLLAVEPPLDVSVPVTTEADATVAPLTASTAKIAVLPIKFLMM